MNIYWTEAIFYFKNHFKIWASNMIHQDFKEGLFLYRSFIILYSNRALIIKLRIIILRHYWQI